MEFKNDENEELPSVLGRRCVLISGAMASADKKKESDVVALMAKPFRMTESSAYQTFIMRLTSDESVVDDSYFEVIQLLLTGLTPDYNRQVQLSLIGKNTTVNDCVEMIRALRTLDLGSASGNLPASSTSESKRINVTGSSNVHFGENSKFVLWF